MKVKFPSLAEKIAADTAGSLPCIVANLIRTVGPCPAGAKAYVVDPEIKDGTVEILSRSMFGRLVSSRVSPGVLDAVRVEECPAIVVLRCWRSDDMESVAEELGSLSSCVGVDFDPGISLSDIVSRKLPSS